MRNRRSPRYSDRQLKVFAVCIGFGLVIGIVTGDAGMWIMTSVIVGAGAIGAMSLRRT